MRNGQSPGLGVWVAPYEEAVPFPGWSMHEPLYPAPAWAQYTARGLPGWKPGHTLQGPSLGASPSPFEVIVSLAVDGATAAGAGYMTTRTKGVLNGVAWIVTIVAALRTFNDVGNLLEKR